MLGSRGDDEIVWGGRKPERVDSVRTMKLVIDMPHDWTASEITDYLERIRTQIDNGNTSGHVDAVTHWTLEKD